MRIHLHFIVWVLLFLLFIAGGAYTYHEVEGWTNIDSVYFVIVTMTTIGYGDLAPVTNVGKIFTMFFSFFAIAMAFYLVSLITGFMFKKHINQRIDRIKDAVESKVEQEKKLKTLKKKKLAKTRSKR